MYIGTDFRLQTSGGRQKKKRHWPRTCSLFQDSFFLARDWTFRGNAVAYNHLHDIGGVGMGAMGVYNDDCASGTHVVGDLFERVKRALMIGGGRDINASGNIFVDCVPAVHLDARPGAWFRPIRTSVVPCHLPSE